MRQALQNIIQNGVEAMTNGGRLRIGVRSIDGIELIISDTGVGIPRDKLDKIFLPFYTTKPRGTGMGLALVHKIILSHGGNIEVDSTTGKGTTFRIYLPYGNNTNSRR